MSGAAEPQGNSLTELLHWHRTQAVQATRKLNDRRGSFHTRKDATKAKAFHETAADTIKQAIACLVGE